MTSVLPPLAGAPRSTFLRQEALNEAIGLRASARARALHVLLQAGGTVVARPLLGVVAVLAIVFGLGAEAGLPLRPAVKTLTKTWTSALGAHGVTVVAAPAPGPLTGP